MKTRTLNGAWTLEIPGTPFAAVPATVPGSVYHDLLAAERIPDPFYRDNEMEALKLMDNDFVYFRSFQVDDALLAGDKVLLRAEGLDTIAAVHINGQIVGEACNMHRIWEFDVKSVLHPGENTITVSFRSPTKYIKEAYAKSVADGSSDAMVGFPNIRKAHCMFGWDWGPRLPDAGIWRPISLVGVEKARLTSVYVTQHYEDGRDVYKRQSLAGMITASPLSTAYLSMDVRRCQMVWSSLPPCSRYSTGIFPAAFSAFCPTPFSRWGRTTSMALCIPSTGEK